jgi:hypothetical protein
MDKLQWFKFAPSDWMMGKIQRCSEVTQARFLRLSCLYWNKECTLSYEDAEIEIDKEHLDVLVSKKIIGVKDGFIFLDFLDEQMDGIIETSAKRREAVRIRWEKAKQKDTKDLQNDTSVLQSDTDKSRVEEEKKRKEKNFVSFWNKYPKKVAKDKCKGIFLKLKESDIDIILDTIDNFLLYKPFEDYNHPNPSTYLNQKRWNDELPEPKKVKKTFSAFKDIND